MYFINVNVLKVSLYSGASATLLGLIFFLLNWNLYDFWGGPMPGYSIALYPGNMSLVYIWHPLFTEEIALIPKMALILIGQFVLTTLGVSLVLYLWKALERRLYR